MPESPAPNDAGVLAHERFVREAKEIDLAYAQGRLREWIDKKVTDERRAAGFDRTTVD